MRASGVMPELPGLGVAHHDDGGGPIVEGAGVAGGDGAAFAEDGPETGQALQGGSRPGAVVLGDHVAVRGGYRDDLPFEESGLLGRHRPSLGLHGELVLLLAGHVLELGHVLSRLAHGDVDVGEGALERRPRIPGRRSPRRGAGLGLGEQRVVRPGIGSAVLVAADRLHAGGDEDIPLAGPDGVGRHPDGLERRRAVTVDGHARHVGQPGQDRGDPADVVAGLTARLARAHDDVLHRLGVELGHLGQHLADDQGGEVVGAAVDQGSLVGPSDRGPAGGDDDGFGHVVLLGTRRPGPHGVGRDGCWTSRCSDGAGERLAGLRTADRTTYRTVTLAVPVPGPGGLRQRAGYMAGRPITAPGRWRQAGWNVTCSSAPGSWACVPVVLVSQYSSARTDGGDGR